jgi:uncharacterized RDD family membrane protein YckC
VSADTSGVARADESVTRMTNPYAPPRTVVQDIVRPQSGVALADRGARLGATILDSLIFAGMVYVPMFFAAFTAEAATSGESAATMVLGAGALTIVGFAVWCWLNIRYVLRNGQSIGKKLVGIKVVRADGTAVSLGRIFWLRNALNAAISIVPLYGLIDILFIFGSSHQCLHDKIADTIVVKA